MADNKTVRPRKKKVIRYPVTRQLWVGCLVAGLLLWTAGLVLWRQQTIDVDVLFAFNPLRLDEAQIVLASQWLSDYGQQTIAAILVVYLLASYRFHRFDAPRTIYLYTVSSYAVSGIATTLLKLVFARPRPLTTFAGEIEVIRDYINYAMPSGHATSSVALILPFVLLVHSRNAVNRTVKVVIALVAAGVCLSRIVLGVHYVGDVVAGVGNAVLWLPVSMLVANWVLRRFQKV